MAVPETVTWRDYAYATEGPYFVDWTRENCVHWQGPLSGQPLDLEEWQVAFFSEAMAVDANELPYWKTVVLDVPRKSGKTTMFAAFGAYHADQYLQGANVGLAATSDEQASELFDAIAAFISASPYLSDRFHVRDYDGEIARTDAGGFLRRIRMDWRRLHGKNMSRVLCDEIHAWSTPNLRKCWEALCTGDAARPDMQVLCITTEGEPDPTGIGILAQIVLDNERYGDVERLPGLTVSRNHESRTLVYRAHAPMPDADPLPVRESYRIWREAIAEGDAPHVTDALRAEYEHKVDVCVSAAKLANPSSWVSRDFLKQKALDPKLGRAAFLRYHCCVATTAETAFVDATALAACIDPDAHVPAGASCVIGADGSRVHDTTVVALAYRDGETIVAQATVFSAMVDTPHHVLHQGRIDYDDVENHIMQLFTDYAVTEAAYDPRYLDRSADILRGRLYEDCIAPVEPTSRHYRDAISALERAILDGRLRWNGDPVLQAHFDGCVAEREPETGAIKRLRKRDASCRIDAVIALALAVWRASEGPQHGTPWVGAW